MYVNFVIFLILTSFQLTPPLLLRKSRNQSISSSQLSFLPLLPPYPTLYVYYTYANAGGKACSGLVIMSKFPIRQAHQIKFDAKGAGTDRAARKGFRM